MPYRLVFEDERGARRTFPLGSDVTVGRSAEGCDVRLCTRNVSRRHARFTVVGGVPFIEDAGSLNGTYVNGVRLRGRRRLKDGDLVRVGDHALLVEMGTSEDTPESTPPNGVARSAPRHTAPARHDESESTVALPAPPPRQGRLRDALAKALKALSGRDESE
jgi:pSer/pThr/pTyr-binding forkhead associated (FHA) protein